MKRLVLAGVLAVFALPATADERAALVESESWSMLRPNVVGDGEILDAQGLYALEAPFRAEDAAMVPVRFVQAQDAPDLRRLILVVDENPAPVVAEFTFGPTMTPIELETRVRVDAYSNVRAIAETVDGTFYMTGRFVRASGGCAAPAATNAAAALASLGQVEVQWHGTAPMQTGAMREAEVTLRHPNHSGLQRDQVTLLFIPPYFIDSLEVRQGGDLLFTMISSISISENPTFRFRYVDSGAGTLHVRATDTKGDIFTDTFNLAM